MYIKIGKRVRGLRLKEGRFKSAARKKFHAVWVARPLKMLARKVVHSFLKVFKVKLDGSLNNLF